MIKKMHALLLVIMLLALLAGCSPAPAPTVAAVATVAATTAPSVDTAATAAVEKAAKESADATKAADEAIMAEATQIAQKTAEVSMAATATREAKKATAVAQKTASAQSTATAVTEATQQASDMADVIADLQKEGNITRDGGTYYTFPDFDESWAQINYYDMWTLDVQPVNFVIRAHYAWEMATTIPNPSGCGFVFRLNEKGDHYMIFLDTHGEAWSQMVKDKQYSVLGHGYAAKVDPIKGEADAMLVVEGSKFAYYINGKRVLRLESASMPKGALALTLISGSNKDFGTRCQMTNIEVWDLGE